MDFRPKKPYFSAKIDDISIVQDVQQRVFQCIYIYTTLPAVFSKNSE